MKERAFDYFFWKGEVPPKFETDGKTTSSLKARVAKQMRKRIPLNNMCDGSHPTNARMRLEEVTEQFDVTSHFFCNWVMLF